MLRVKYERLARGWSQVALAFHTRISIGDVGRIETGRLRPYACQLGKLAAVLGVEQDDLLKEVVHPVAIDTTADPYEERRAAAAPEQAAVP